jgi:hypothetical protein
LGWRTDQYTVRERERQRERERERERERGREVEVNEGWEETSVLVRAQPCCEHTVHAVGSSFPFSFQVSLSRFCVPRPWFACSRLSHNKKLCNRTPNSPAIRTSAHYKNMSSHTTDRRRGKGTETAVSATTTTDKHGHGQGISVSTTKMMASVPVQKWLLSKRRRNEKPPTHGRAKDTQAHTSENETHPHPHMRACDQVMKRQSRAVTTPLSVRSRLCM